MKAWNVNCFSNNKELNDEKQIKLDCRLGKVDLLMEVLILKCVQNVYYA